MKNINIIIFGAGMGGQKLTEELEERCEPFEILAYADNNSDLHGSMLFGKPVIHPSRIKDFAFDQIIVPIMDAHTVKNQLIEEYGIDSAKIVDRKPLYTIFAYKAREIALKNASLLLADVPGAVAELGVFQGDFACHINALFPDRSLYLFDTFEGFPEQDVAREASHGAENVARQWFKFAGTNESLVLGKMPHPETCIIRKGYFPQTALGLEETFAFVSLDADLYEPMLAGLRYFYPRLSKGGFIFAHDFFNDLFTGTRQAVLDYQKEQPLVFIPLGDGLSVGIIKG